MALTATQRAQVRLYCGWSARWRQTDSRLEQSMNAIDAGDVDSQTLVTDLLASLADIDTKLIDAHKRLKAKKLGSIDLPGNDEMGMLRSEGRRFVGRLCALLGVEVRQDVFAGNGPSFYSNATGLHKGTGGSNLPPLG